MKIVLRWKNPWLRVVVYVLLILALMVVMGGNVQFVYQRF